MTAAIRTGTRLLDFSQRFLAQRQLPAVLAFGAILVMLPALKVGLGMDDLPQRSVELRPDQLPPRMHETSNPADSGSLPTVLFDLFGLDRDPQCVALMKNYGTLPWWTPDDFKLSLCRPVAAFTHWLDYRLYPDSPTLMHAHNIAWFAAVVFLVAMVYRRLMGTGWAAGLAALLFLLDGNTYFPVTFVANRGFIMALFFGLLCLYEHHQWRSARSRSALVLSLLALALSVFAEEGGASTFAFILAYALVLEPGSVRHRVMTLLPSVPVLVLWRTIYILAGYGLSHVGVFYIDPLNEPFRFAWAALPRVMVLLGSQLTAVPPELLLAIKPSLQPVGMAFYGVCVVAALAVLLPSVRRDKLAVFWLATTVLAAIPESSLVPLSKNFGFVAVGTYGLIASFVAGVMTRRLPERPGCRMLAGIACVLLLLVHVPGAIAGRMATVKVVGGIFAWARRVPPTWPNIENQNVIVVNHPLPMESAYVPSYAASHAKAIPTPYQFERLNFTLVVSHQVLNAVQISPTVEVSAFSNFRINNKDLLNLLATAFNTNWPEGARLALEINSEDIFVVDKTGTNPVFDVTIGINEPDPTYPSVVFFSHDSNPIVVNEKLKTGLSGTFHTRTTSGKIFFHLFCERDGTITTDLYLDGLGKVVVNRSFIPTSDTTTRQETIPVTGDGTFNSEWTVVKGAVTGSGKWKHPLP
ncbi:MAG: hypothetical protein ACLQAH_04070 [Limisphaerales bacterium]